jgi:hypothetical protein
MRVAILSFAFALAIAFAIAIVLSITGFGEPIGIFLAAAVGVLFFAGVMMAYEPTMLIREIVKQIAIWAAVTALLPLSVWYGTRVFSSPPDWEAHSKAASRLQEEIGRAEDRAERDKLREEKDRLDEELKEAERVFYGHMFWVAYPIGLVAIVLGTFYPVQAVGAGLMFGGLSALTAGCYSHWDEMSEWLRFGSLVLALVVVLVLGTLRFRAVNVINAPAP